MRREDTPSWPASGNQAEPDRSKGFTPTCPIFDPSGTWRSPLAKGTIAWTSSSTQPRSSHANESRPRTDSKSCLSRTSSVHSYSQTSSFLEDFTGRFFKGTQPSESDAYSRDSKVQKRIWREGERLVGESFPGP